ncbi:MAG TPA: hypothetical protein VFQ61_08080 [Polyangiaceae bacterium]|nr:hypothetical protein [Polyangiaceae bacterium]
MSLIQAIGGEQRGILAPRALSAVFSLLALAHCSVNEPKRTYGAGGSEGGTAGSGNGGLAGVPETSGAGTGAASNGGTKASTNSNEPLAGRGGSEFGSGGQSSEEEATGGRSGGAPTVSGGGSGAVGASAQGGAPEGTAGTSGDSAGAAGESGTEAPLQVVDLALGESHSCAVFSDQTVKCWGSNFLGQLGDGTDVGSRRPIRVASLAGVTSVAAKASHTCAALTDGTVKCWGDNMNGQVVNGKIDTSYVPRLVPGLLNVVQVGTGPSHACALLEDQTVRCWGSNRWGQLGNGESGISPSGVEEKWVLQPTPVIGLAKATQVVAGNDFSCALLRDGSARCWGNNYDRQLGNQSTEPSPTPVGVWTTANLTQLGAASIFVWGLAMDGKVTFWGAKSPEARIIGSWDPEEVPGISDAIQVTGGGAHACALIRDGSILCWGTNWNGQQGIGTKTRSDVVGKVLTVEPSVRVVAGDDHTCAIASDRRRVMCWGDNWAGQLGDGTITTAPSPVMVEGLFDD